MRDIHIRVGTLECKRTGLDENRYSILHHPRPEHGYVALYIRRRKGEDPDFETVGYRPWTAKEDGGTAVDVWTFARACATFIQQCAEEEEEA